MRINGLSIAGAVAGLFASVLSAQEYRGKVQGTVTDAFHGVIVKANVKLTNVNTGVDATRQTSDSGRYLFDYVDPGQYSLTVDMQGFDQFVQRNIQVEARADITVDAALTVGTTQQKVIVEASPVSIEFNSSNETTTLDTKTVQSIPNLYGNPFKLAMLDASVAPDPGGYGSPHGVWSAPYSTWAANAFSAGGSPSWSSDLTVDGSPVTVAYKTSYVPSTDAVQELVVQKNAVDAEYGNSAGTSVTIALKSGTNEFHGTAFYRGQYPWLDALDNRVFRSTNQERDHFFGGTLGNPIRRNKLFNFFSYEQWKQASPGLLVNTQPTDLERQGNFSQSFGPAGSVLTIYDPRSTRTDSAGNVTRTPFTGNTIPASRMDLIALRFMQDIWKPNNPGQDITGLNNFTAAAPLDIAYRNISDRVDYHVTDRLVIYGRYSIYRSTSLVDNPTGSPGWLAGDDARYRASNYAGNMTYTLGARTVINVRGEYHGFWDDYLIQHDYAGEGGWAAFWPDSTWWKPAFPEGVPVYYPMINIQGKTSLGLGGFWYQHPDGGSADLTISHDRGAHYLKAGFGHRRLNGRALLESASGFSFNSNLTASTYVQPDTRYSGNPYATFLLGALDAGGGPWSGDTDIVMPMLSEPQSRSYSAFFNDSWKISRKLTLTLGLRYEYESPWTDPQDRLYRGLDLAAPNPTLANNAPQMPAIVQQYYAGSWSTNGSFAFTDSSHRGMWNGVRNGFLPRVGAAYRLNDKTALRAGWARYASPWIFDHSSWSTGAFNDIVYVGYQSDQGAPPTLQGVPQVFLNDPFPSTHPLVPPIGKGYGANTGLGDSLEWANPNRTLPTIDRFNIGIQRQLPRQFVLDVTYFLNRGHNLPYSKNVNLTDPSLWYRYGPQLEQSVDNPFYNFATPDQFPGPLRYQQQVSLASLLRPYPQYLGLTESQVPGGGSQYQSLDFKVQRPFAKGFNLLVNYNYHLQKNQTFFDDIATYSQTWSWQDAGMPRHAITGSGTWELPAGKGRPWLSSAPRLVNALVGGWNLTGNLSWRSGFLLRFGALQVSGDPRVSDPSPERWFNASAFQPLPAYTPRTNPWYYSGLNGPGLFNLDATLQKDFAITEQKRFEARMSAYNALNGFTPSNPDMDVYSSTFGQAPYQLSNTFGRRVELGLKFVF